MFNVMWVVMVCAYVGGNMQCHKADAELIFYEDGELARGPVPISVGDSWPRIVRERAFAAVAAQSHAPPGGEPSGAFRS